MASWWGCKYPGCNKRVWSPIQQVSCEEHRGQTPETAKPVPTKFASELEIEELEIENKFLREQLEAREQEHQKTIAAYIDLQMKYYELESQGRKEPSWMVPGYGYRPGGAITSGPNGNLYWSPNGF